jgi:hypothetical protein
VLNSDKLSFKADGFGILAPGASATKFVVKPITGDLLNSAVVEAVPTNAAGAAIPDLEKVSSEDTSEVEKERHSPGVMVTNTVYLGEDGGKKCGSADVVEYVAEKVRARIWVCCTWRDLTNAFSMEKMSRTALSLRTQVTRCSMVSVSRTARWTLYTTKFHRSAPTAP